jgi:hypothetical protein
MEIDMIEDEYDDGRTSKVAKGDAGNSTTTTRLERVWG